MSQKHKGSKHWNWQGGRTSLQEEIRKCFQYKIWRKLVFERDSYMCQVCGNRGGKLQADHKVPFSVILLKNNITTFIQALGCQKLWDIDNGNTLCLDCHKQIESYLKPLSFLTQLFLQYE